MSKLFMSTAKLNSLVSSLENSLTGVVLLQYYYSPRIDGCRTTPLMPVLNLAERSYGYINPVQGNRDSPDPGVIYYNGAYYAATTEGWDGHYFPIWRSESGTNFTQVGWVMQAAPSWTKCCDYWAPEIHIIDGKFTVYYTASSAVTGRLSIGVTQSTNILGPYTDKGSPIMSNLTDGIIDPTVLTVNGTRYLVYKVNNRGRVEPSYLLAIQLSATGLSVGGPTTMLLRSS